MEKKVFWSGIEYHYKTGSSSIKKLKGGFVYVFSRAFDVRDALENILTEMNKRGLLPIEIEYISPYDSEMEWEVVKDNKHYLELYNQAAKSDIVVFDDFYAYENE